MIQKEIFVFQFISELKTKSLKMATALRTRTDGKLESFCTYTSISFLFA